MALRFFKYQGTGNDFVIIDDRNKQFEPNPGSIKQMCDRRFGIGGDGLILYRQTPNADFHMVYYNADGYPGTMCGNGGRCIVKWAWESGLIGKKAQFDAPDGIHKAQIGQNGLISLQMNDVTELEQKENDWVLDTGSPHYVIFKKQVDELDVFHEGKLVRNSTYYKDHGINVNFVQILDEGNVKVRTYERGVEMETYSCGTGVIASAIAAYYQLQLQRPHYQVKVHTKGGPLEVNFKVAHNGGIRDIWLNGPAEKVFEGYYVSK